MSKRIFDHFVADGQQRIQATAEYRHKAQEIHTRVWAQYRAEFSQASFGRRLILRWKIWRTIRQACAELAPPHALYLRAL